MVALQPKASWMSSGERPLSASVMQQLQDAAEVQPATEQANSVGSKKLLLLLR